MGNFLNFCNKERIFMANSDCTWKEKYTQVYPDAFIHCGSSQLWDSANRCQDGVFNGHLEEDTYMMQPNGFAAKNQEQRVYKL